MRIHARRALPANLACGRPVDVARIQDLQQANQRKRKGDAVDSLGTDFDALLTRGALAALVVAAGWALAMVVAVALEARTAGRVRLAERAGCPPAVRLWLLGVFVALFAGVAPATASDTGGGTRPGAGAALGAALDGLPLPDRVADEPRRSPRSIVVRPGDTLWQIARAHLPQDAADPAVAALVTHLYAVNRRTIGPDPDLIRPGQRLLVDVPDTPPEAP
jgi:nucleoid-associated protein YgaU